jgi:hypothetical protein
MQSTKRGEALRFIKETVLEYEGDECVIWPFYRREDGYAKVKYQGRDTTASFAVCEMAHGKRPSKRHQAAHSCGRGHEGCVAKNHLSWKTRKGNAKDKIDHGTHTMGSRNPWAKLTEEDAAKILKLKGKKIGREVAELFDTSLNNVYRIWARKSWKHIKRRAPVSLAGTEAA